jgi:E-phenylitaconyl-CoA hydratase
MTERDPQVPDEIEGLTVERDGPVAVVVLDRPAQGNSVTAAMHAGLRSFWEEVAADDATRAVVVTGAGSRHFCTGADVEALARSRTVSAGDGPLKEELFYTARHCEVWKPVVCAVNGLVAAAGLHFVVDADIVVADRSAVFMDTHVSVGMIGALENIGLAKRMPLGAALRMTLLGREYRMSADRAYELGLVDELAEEGQARAVAVDMAQAIARQSPTAVEKSLRAIWGSLELPYAEALERGWTMVKEHRSHPDAAEGPKAFVERRRPRWAPLTTPIS